MRGQGLEDPFIVGVEPVYFFGVEELRYQGRGVEVTEGERFEAEPGTKVIGAVFYAQEQVFVPYPMPVFAVDAGLVGNDHAR